MTGTKKIIRESLTIVAFSFIILLYSLFVGQLLLGLIVIFLIIILLRLIRDGVNNYISNPILWIISIILFLYSFYIGQLLLGLIAVLQIAILWVLFYRTSKKIKEKHYDNRKRPTGITVLAVFYAYTVISGILKLITGQSALVFGVTLSGVSAQLVYVILIIISAYLIYGFIKLLKPAWIIAIIFGLYGLLNISINIISHSLYMSFFVFSLLLNIIILTYILGKADYFKN